MRDLKELNINDAGRSVTKEAPSPSQISAIENLITAKLPAKYIEFLKFSNGGHPELDTFHLIKNDKTSQWSINNFFHISDDINSTGSVTWNIINYKSIPPNILPIANDGGGNLICLDLSQSRYGSVILWIHDIAEEKLHLIADSFELFLDLLEANPDYI